MLVANSFDLWQKDAFFSAAEEVQKSSDIMESAYRTWLRARREGLMPQHLDAIERELRMALGTAKWQLEELERAVRLSYRSHGDYITITRHSQFVSAIEDQISNVEKAFKESFSSEGRRPFRWVNLNDEECDDLALFLSGTSSLMTTDEKSNTKEVSSEIQVTQQENQPQEVASGNEDDISCRADITASNHRSWGPQEKGTLEIVVIDGDDDDGEKSALIGEMCKEKVSAKPSFWSMRVEERVEAKGGFLSRNNTQLRMISWINQRLRGGHRQRQLQVSPVLPVNSIRFILALILTIFLVVPFLVYSNGAELKSMEH